MNLLPLVIAYSLLLIQNVSSASSPWDYHDVAKWKEEYEFCAAIDESPININDTNTINDNKICDGSFDWTIDKTKQTWKVINNGHSVVLKPVEIYNIGGLTEDQIMARRRMFTVEELSDEQLKELDLNHNTIAKFPNYFTDATSTIKHYCLDSIHFHWGNTDNYGSEHTINEKHYPIEAHFVHYSCNYDDLGSAMEKFQTIEDVAAANSAGEDVHVLGVVSVMYEIEDIIVGLDTSFTQLVNDELFEKVKLPHEAGDKAVVISNFSLGIDNLIPVMNENEGYYSYEGSLTTPPCTDIVRWIVMKHTGKISPSELELFRSLENGHGSTIAPNYRDIQTNLNTVYKCDSEWYSEDDSDEELFKENLNTLKKIGIYVAVVGSVFCIAMCIGLCVCIYAMNRKKSNDGMQRVRNDESDVDV